MKQTSESKSSSESKKQTISLTDKSRYKNLLACIWPITYSELPKFLSITLLMFCILGIQNLIRAMKDSVVNTMIGTETISFLKLWGVLPASFFVIIVYVKLINVMKEQNIFYLMMSSFVGFFLLFAFYLFPNHTNLHIDIETANNLILSYPNFKWFILLISNWSFSLFYVIAELWPTAIFSLLFWQFVNNITTIGESKRFYFLFGLLGQTGLFLSGKFLINLPLINEYFRESLHLTASRSVISIQIVICVVLSLATIGMVTFWFINNYIIETSKGKKLQIKPGKKDQITLKESCKMIINSRYIRLITILLVCYGFAINIVEGPWKYEASKIYQTPTEFASFVGNYLSYTGILTIIFVLLGSNIVRSLGWMSAAIITPFMVFATGLIFFLITNFDPISLLISMSFALPDPVILGVIIGAIQNVLSKSTKYTLFDSTKEMSYVPLDKKLKTRGKAAADMIGVKLGKSVGALLQSMIFIIVPTATYSSVSPFLMCVFCIVCIIWISAVCELNKEYKFACNAIKS